MAKGIIFGGQLQTLSGAHLELVKKQNQAISLWPIQQAWKNRVYTINMFKWAGEYRADTLQQPPMISDVLFIQRLDKKIDISWEHLQRIKNETVGPRREAVEIFPPEIDEVSTKLVRVLWVLPELRRLPFSFHRGKVLEVDNK